MQLPTIEECEKLLEEYRVPKHIRRHMDGVRMVAVKVAKLLKSKGIDINIEIVDRAARLHDILKTIEFSGLGNEFTLDEIQFFSELQERFRGMEHEVAAFELLKDKYPKIAEAIRKHRYRAIVQPEMAPWTWEEKILTYADKRIAHDKTVSLKERFEEGHKRYFAKNKEAKCSDNELERIDSAYFEIEKEIFDIIGIESNEVT